MIDYETIIHCFGIAGIRRQVGQETFRMRRPNRYTSRGYEDRLSGHRVKMCLRRIGHHIRRLRLRPISDYYYLGQFLRYLLLPLHFSPTFMWRSCLTICPPPGNMIVGLHSISRQSLLSDITPHTVPPSSLGYHPSHCPTIFS